MASIFIPDPITIAIFFIPQPQPHPQLSVHRLPLLLIIPPAVHFRVFFVNRLCTSNTLLLLIIIPSPTLPPINVPFLLAKFTVVLESFTLGLLGSPSPSPSTSPSTFRLSPFTFHLSSFAFSLNLLSDNLSIHIVSSMLCSWTIGHVT